MALVVVAVIAFARALSYGLVESWDDKRFLVEFEPVQSVSLENLVTIFSGTHFEAYHPLHLLSYWIDVPWFGTGAVHATSLVLWVGALLLLRRVFTAWGLSLLFAALAAAFVGVHPVQVEAVVWATGRKEILALLFVSLAALSHDRSEGLNDKDAWLSRLFFVLGALSKTTVLPLPLVLLLVDWKLKERTLKDAFARQLPMLGVALGLGVVVVRVWTENEMIRPPLEGTGPIQLVAATLTHYVGTAIAPIGTSPMYPIHRVAEDFSHADWLGPGLLAGALFLRNRILTFVALGFLALIAPVSNLQPVYYDVFDRYLSLPLIPLAFGLAYALSNWKPAGTIAGAGVVIVLAGLSFQYTGVWQSDLQLWTHATEQEPEAFYAWLKLGEAERELGHMDASLAAYETALHTEPQLQLASTAYFHALLRFDEERYGLPPRAEEHARAFQLGSRDVDGLRELGHTLLTQGYRRSVIAPLELSLQLASVDSDRLERAARVQLEQGHLWLTRFYLSKMRREPVDETLSGFIRWLQANPDTDLFDLDPEAIRNAGE